MSLPISSRPQFPGMAISMPSSSDTRAYRCSYCGSWKWHVLSDEDPIIIKGNFACLPCEKELSLKGSQIWNGKINRSFSFYNMRYGPKRTWEILEKDYSYLFSQEISKERNSKEN